MLVLPAYPLHHSPIHRLSICLDLFLVVSGSTKKMKKKLRLGGTPNEIRAGKTQQNESDMPRSVNLFLSQMNRSDRNSTAL